MKKITQYLMYSLLFFAVITTTVMTAAHAANKEGQFSLSPVIGGITFDGQQSLDTRPFYGVRGGYNFTDNLGVEALFDYARTEYTHSNDHVDFYRYGGELLYHFMPDARLVPYVAAGYAGVNYNASNGTASSKVVGAFDYGLGLKYFLADNIALRGDVRHLMYSDDDTLNAIEYSLGLYIPFGATNSEPKLVAQQDERPIEKTIEKPAPEPVQEQPKEAPLEPVPAKEPEPGRYKYCITLLIDFDIDKADIRTEYDNQVAKVGNFMKQFPTTTAVIEGHTDEVGTHEHNMELSQRRAESVVNYLVDHFGIERSRLSAKGYGSSRPVAGNATNEGGQQNRRIEAIIDCAFDVKKTEPPDTLCMSLQIEFDNGKADIYTEYHGQIASVGEYMKKYPTTKALIEGHTDNIGGHDNNMRLSQQRAENVVNYLIKNFGIESSRLTAKGFGDTRRIAYNSTPEGRQKNRRITAVIDCTTR